MCAAFVVNTIANNAQNDNIIDIKTSQSTINTNTHKAKCEHNNGVCNGYIHLRNGFAHVIRHCHNNEYAFVVPVYNRHETIKWF